MKTNELIHRQVTVTVSDIKQNELFVYENELFYRCFHCPVVHEVIVSRAFRLDDGACMNIPIDTVVRRVDHNTLEWWKLP